MADLGDLGRAYTDALANREAAIAQQREGFAPPATPQLYFGAESRDLPRPQLRGGLELQTLGGVLGLGGSYQPIPQAPAQFDARAQYRRQF